MKHMLTIVSSLIVGSALTLAACGGEKKAAAPDPAKDPAATPTATAPAATTPSAAATPTAAPAAGGSATTEAKPAETKGGW